MKLLIVYNTCGKQKDNPDFYIDSIKDILVQNFDDMVVLWSGCKTGAECRKRMIREFGHEIVYNLTDGDYPVNVTFNHSCIKATEKFGLFDGYLYLDSGIKLDHTNRLNLLYDKLKTNQYGIISTPATNDNALSWIFGSEMLVEEDRIIPVGKAINQHAFLYHSDIYKRFGRIQPDIFASNCSESVLGYICQAVKKQWLLCGGEGIRHQKALDGPSSIFGFATGPLNWNHTFKTKKDLIQIMNDPEAFQCGFGYEECGGIFPHNREAYDENYNIIDAERLARFLEKNIYLQKEDFDYSEIESEFIP